jgi:hypothetical protein
MAAPARASVAPPADERVWLKRTVLVLVRPREVFEALRDDSETAARARSEAVLALVLLSGIAGVLWAPVAGRILDDVTLDWLDVAVWAFLGGGLYGAATYFVGGFVLYGLTRLVGGVTYRQSRHLLAFASAPLALSLFLIWPFRLAIYGTDVFREGGSDHGAGNDVFVGLGVVFGLWALGLLVMGLHALLRREPAFERV